VSVGEVQPLGREGRRVVTALFADVVGSTALVERLDPEDYHELIGGALTRMIGAIENLGGSIRDLAGDGVLALFGAPIAHEDDAERAALAALAIQDRIAEYAGEAAERWSIEGFSVRVGIETGLAALGPIGGGKAAPLGAMGDVLNTAARLQAKAAPGAILVGPVTRQLIEPGFDWETLEALQLKGKAEPVRASVLVGRTRAGAGSAATAVEAPLIGREAELALAGEAIAELVTGRGGVVVLTGEAGVGKSRLLEEAEALFHRSRPEGPAAWLHGQCVSYGESIPALPLRAVVRELIKVESHDEGSTRAALERRAGELVGDRAGDVVAFLAPLVGLKGSRSEQENAAGLSPRERRRRTVAALRTVLLALAAQGPVVLAIDDLQWADATTVQTLGGLLASTTEAGLLLVFSSRSEPDHDSWRLGEQARRDLPDRTRVIGLQPLARGADRELLRALTGEEGLPEALASQLLARAAGNPFYIEELVRSLADAGALHLEAQAPGSDRKGQLELPQSIERVILARLDRLPAAARELAGTASVLGRDFERPLLEELREGGAGAFEGLLELLRSRLVVEVPGSPPSYRFRHQIIREAIYGSLLKRRRRELHARAAAALRRLTGEPGGEHLGILARHYEAAGHADQAFDYHRRAGDFAARLGAGQEAAAHYAGALAVAKAVSRPPDPALLRDLRREVAIVNVAHGARLNEGLAGLRAVVEEARHDGDRRGEMLALSDVAYIHKVVNLDEGIALHQRALAIAEEIGDPGERVHVLTRLALCYANRALFDRGLEVSRRALAVGRKADDATRPSGGRRAQRRLVELALDGLKLNLVGTGDLGALERTCAELEASLRDGGDPWLLQWCLLEGLSVPVGRCEWDVAEARLDEVLALNDHLGDRVGKFLIQEMTCQVRRAKGELGAALTAGREAHGLAIEDEVPYFHARTAATLGKTLLDLFAAPEAEPLLVRGLEVAERSRAHDQRIRCTAELARARLAQGLRAEALELAEAGEALLGEVSAPPGEVFLQGAHAYLSVAEVLVALGDPDRAKAVAAPVLEAARRHGSLEAIAGAAIVLADCGVATGESAGVGELLSEALTTAERGQLPAAALRTHAILARTETARGDAARHHARATELLERLEGTIDDPGLRDMFRQGAEIGLGGLSARA